MRFPASFSKMSVYVSVCVCVDISNPPGQHAGRAPLAGETERKLEGVSSSPPSFRRISTVDKFPPEWVLKVVDCTHSLSFLTFYSFSLHERAACLRGLYTDK